MVQRNGQRQCPFCVELVARAGSVTPSAWETCCATETEHSSNGRLLRCIVFVVVYILRTSKQRIAVRLHNDVVAWRNGVAERDDGRAAGNGRDGRSPAVMGNGDASAGVAVSGTVGGDQGSRGKCGGWRWRANGQQRLVRRWAVDKGQGSRGKWRWQEGEAHDSSKKKKHMIVAKD